MDHQDWTTVTLRKKTLTPQELQKRSQTVAKRDSSDVGRRFAEQDFPKLRFLTPESRTYLIQARVAQKLSQRDLDIRCAFPANTIRDLESGKLAPTSKHLSALQRFFPGSRFTVEHEEKRADS